MTLRPACLALCIVVGCSAGDAPGGGSGGWALDDIPGLAAADGWGGDDSEGLDAVTPRSEDATDSGGSGGPADTGAVDSGGAGGGDSSPTDSGTPGNPCLDDDCLQCRPCMTDADCGGEALCRIAGETGRFCSVPCEESPCPGGLACDRAGYCVPWPGKECPCLEGYEDAPTVCAAGACEAPTTCGVECPAAEPVTEVCNGADDDCNGETDEGLGDMVCGVGVCARLVPKCVGGNANLCDPLEGATEEVCNGKDDDCDGKTDEDLGSLPCGVGACAHTVPACFGGKPGECTGPTAGAKDEVCNGKDDDCDGLTDEELGTVPCGSGACSFEVPACVGGVAGPCDPESGPPEECNGLDDDCDGEVDEAGCPCPSVHKEGRTYLLCSGKVTWNTAKNNCASAGDGYHLVTIQSAAENAFVAGIAAAVSTSHWWIGLTDSGSEGAWKWVTGEDVLYGPPWAPGEPGEPDDSGTEKCAIIGVGWDGAPWVDVGCSESYSYVCEHD
ncbi:MAG: hypothetical protein AMXMBFR64_04340 [Myxococcales bacterium]